MIVALGASRLSNISFFLLLFLRGIYSCNYSARREG